MVGDEQVHPFTGVGAPDTDVPESAGVADGQVAALADAVLLDPEVDHGSIDHHASLALDGSQLGHAAIQASISLSSPVLRASGRKLAVTELRANPAITSSLKPNVARRAS